MEPPIGAGAAVRTSPESAFRRRALCAMLALGLSAVAFLIVLVAWVSMPTSGSFLILAVALTVFNVCGAITAVGLRRRPLVAVAAGIAYVLGLAVAATGDRVDLLLFSLAALAGPPAAAALEAWRPFRKGEVWAKLAAPLSVAAVGMPILLMLIAAAHPGGAYAGLASVGRAMGVAPPVDPSSLQAQQLNCPGAPYCGVSGTMIEPSFLNQALAPLLLFALLGTGLLGGALVAAPRRAPGVA